MRVAQRAKRSRHNAAASTWLAPARQWDTSPAGDQAAHDALERLYCAA